MAQCSSNTNKYRADPLNFSLLPYGFKTRLFNLAPEQELIKARQINAETFKLASKIANFTKSLYIVRDQIGLTVANKSLTENKTLLDFFNFQIFIVQDILAANVPIYVDDTLLIFNGVLPEYNSILPLLKGNYVHLCMNGLINFDCVLQLLKLNVKVVHLNGPIELTLKELKAAVKLLKEKLNGRKCRFRLHYDFAVNVMFMTLLESEFGCQRETVGISNNTRLCAINLNYPLIDTMAPTTIFGKKPAVFTLNGERYYIGSDVGYYMNCLRGKLYKFFPNMWRRVATQEEKKIISEITRGEASVSSNVMLVRAREVEDILAGNDEKYRTADSLNGTPSRPRDIEGTPVNSPRILKHVNNTPSWNIAIESTDQTTTVIPIGAGKGRLRRRDHIFDPIDRDQHAALLRNARIPEELVPIRLDLDIDGVRVRDNFCYNKNESLMTPEQFAEVLCEDLEITTHGAVAQIAASIKHQLAAHDKAIMHPLLEDSIDQRAQIKVSVNVQNENLTDILEWDLASPDNSPEEFSKQLCKDLQIGGEFVPGIATAIRSQIVYYRKTFAHIDLQLPTVSSVHPMRSENDADLCGPKLKFLSDADLEKKMRDSDRNTRRMRRLAASTPY